MRREAGFIDGGTAGCVIAKPDPTSLALALQEAPDAPGDGVCQMVQLSSRRRLHPTKSQARSSSAIDVETIEKKYMEVHIEIESTPESLNQRHGAGAGRCAGESPFLIK